MPARYPKRKPTRLHLESGRVYTDLLVRHYRLYRKQGVWMAPRKGDAWKTRLAGQRRSMPIVEMRRSQGFCTACKTAKACKAAGSALQKA